MDKGSDVSASHPALPVSARQGGELVPFKYISSVSFLCQKQFIPPFNSSWSEEERGNTITYYCCFRNAGYGTGSQDNQAVMAIRDLTDILVTSYPGHSPVIRFDGVGGIQMNNVTIENVKMSCV